MSPIRDALLDALRQEMRSGTTLRQLSATTGLDKAALSKFLSGVRSLSLDSADRLAVAFGFRVVRSPRGRRRRVRKV